jgi:hypothetical protein
MLVLRIVGFLVLLVTAGSVVTALVTGDRRWLRFAGQVLRWGVVLASVFLAFYLFERLVMVV